MFSVKVYITLSYKAVEACSQFACDLGINIPTGKDSLSMTQKYGDEKVFAPGTVIISAGGEVSDIKKVVSPVLIRDRNTAIYYIDFSFDNFQLGGSAFAQSLGKIGKTAPTVKDSECLRFSVQYNTRINRKGPHSGRSRHFGRRYDYCPARNELWKSGRRFGNKSR